MQNIPKGFLLSAVLALALNGCGTSPSPTFKVETATATLALSTATPVTATPTPTLTPEPTLPPIPVIIQEGNMHPKFGLHPKRSGELEDNRIGAFAGGLTGGGWKPGDPWDYEWMVDQIVSRGVKRFRVAIDNQDAGSPDLDWSIPQYTIDPSHDALITLLSQEGITMTYVLTFWDKDTWPGGKGANCPRFKSEAEVDRYLKFVQFIVHHFKDRIQNYEIWNEPNTVFCPQRIEIVDYINLVRRASPIIRQEYPQAKIVVGATNYLGQADSQEYLLEILDSDIMPLVDIISWHPMYGTSPEFDSTYYSKYSSIVLEIKDTAFAHGFNGTYEADELTWFTANGNWDGWSKQYSDTVSGKYMARGIVMHLGMDITAGIGSALIFDSQWISIPFVVHNLSSTMAGAKVAKFPVNIDTDIINVANYSFSLPNGDKLIALWNDGVAVDDDPGVPSVVTISDYPNWKATGIDILNGFEQELITSNENGNLVIPNFLIKDYPTIIRLSK
jgi:hypothetical protein